MNVLQDDVHFVIDEIDDSTLYIGIYSYSLRAGKSFEKVHQRQGRVLHQHKSTNFSLEL